MHVEKFAQMPCQPHGNAHELHLNALHEPPLSWADSLQTTALNNTQLSGEETKAQSNSASFLPARPLFTVLLLPTALQQGKLHIQPAGTVAFPGEILTAHLPAGYPATPATALREANSAQQHHTCHPRASGEQESPSEVSCCWLTTVLLPSLPSPWGLSLPCCTCPWVPLMPWQPGRGRHAACRG